MNNQIQIQKSKTSKQNFMSTTIQAKNVFIQKNERLSFSFFSWHYPNLRHRKLPPGDNKSNKWKKENRPISIKV